jgi:hypothetical protein
MFHAFHARAYVVGIESRGGSSAEESLSTRLGLDCCRDSQTWNESGKCEDAFPALHLHIERLDLRSLLARSSFGPRAMRGRSLDD